MREIIMRPTRSFLRAALSASLLSTLPFMLGVSAMLAECSVAIADGNVLTKLRPVTDEMLQRPDPGDWLMRRGGYPARGVTPPAPNPTRDSRGPPPRLGPAAGGGDIRKRRRWCMTVSFFLEIHRTWFRRWTAALAICFGVSARASENRRRVSQRPVRSGARHDRAVRRQGLADKRGRACRGFGCTDR